MFSLTHYYIAKEAGFSDPYTIFGATIMPDLAWDGVISWQDLHQKAQNFRNFYKENREKDLLNLIIGNIIHLAADDLVHHKNPGDYKGWGIQVAKPLESDVKNLLGFEGDEISQYSHSFIETAIDSLLLENNQELKYSYSTLLDKVDIKYVAEKLSIFFKKDVSVFEKSIKDFLAIFNYMEMKGDISYAKIWQQVMKEKNLNENNLLEMIMKAKMIIQGQYKGFLLKCIKKTKALKLKEL